MARILPGSLGSTFSGVQRARELREGAVDYARAPDTPHGFDALAKTLKHPLTGMATSAISRVADEVAYARAVDEEKERLDKARFEHQQAQEAAQNVSRYRQTLEQRLADPMMQAAIEQAKAYQGPGGPVDLGHAGSTQTGMTSTGVPTTVTHGAIGQPTEPGWKDPQTGKEYSYSQLRGLPEELARLQREEAEVLGAIGPAPQERFVPRTVAEFQAAIASETDPQRRRELLMQSTRAVDAQPAGVIEAIKGRAGARAQKATYGAGIEAQERRHEQAAKIEDLRRKREEFDFDQRHKEAKLSLDRTIAASKHAKRQSDIKHTQLKMQKLSRRIAAVGRRRGMPGHVRELFTKYGGFSKAATSSEFYDELAQVTTPKEFKHWQGVLLKQVKDTMGKEVAVPLAVRSELRVAELEKGRSTQELERAASDFRQAEAKLVGASAVASQVLGRHLPSNWIRDVEIMEDLEKKNPEYAKEVRGADIKRGQAAERVRVASARDKRATHSYEAVLKRAGSPKGGWKIVGEVKK